MRLVSREMGANEGYGGNVNRVIREDEATSIYMTQVASTDVNMVLSSQVGNACATASWTGLRDLYEAFLRDGELEYVESAGPSGTGETVDCALATPFVLQPGEKTHDYLCSHLVFSQHQPWYAYLGETRQYVCKLVD